MLTRLIAGLVLFHGVHLIPTFVNLRNRLRERFGANLYLLAFSLVSAVALYLIVTGYGEARIAGRANPVLWQPPAFGRHLVHLLMLISFIFLVAAYVPSRIRTAVKHPMLAAVKIWALAHLLVRGDLASVLLFGSFLVYAVYDRISVKRRTALGPLGVATGRPVNDVVVVGGGLLLYAVFLFWGHDWLIGVPAINLSFAR